MVFTRAFTPLGNPAAFTLLRFLTTPIVRHIRGAITKLLSLRLSVLYADYVCMIKKLS